MTRNKNIRASLETRKVEFTAKLNLRLLLTGNDNALKVIVINGVNHFRPRNKRMMSYVGLGLSFMIDSPMQTTI